MKIKARLGYTVSSSEPELHSDYVSKKQNNNKNSPTANLETSNLLFLDDLIRITASTIPILKLPKD
jgi:hypothetical protein